MTQEQDDSDTPPWLQAVPEGVDVGAARLSGRRSLLLTVGLCALLVVGFVALISYGYRASKPPKPVPHVAAATTPIKVAPEDPGGKQFDHQDKQIFDIAAGRPVIESSDTLQDVAETPLTDLAANMAQPEETVEGQAPDVSVPIPQESQNGSQDTPKNAGTNAGAVIEDGDPLNPGDPASSTPVGQATMDTPPADIRAPASVSAQDVGQGAGRYQVQLGAFGEEAGARAAWRRALDALPTSLRPLTPSYENVDVAGRVLVRVRAGDVGTRAEADTLCLEVRSKDLPCMVVTLQAEQTP